MQPTVASRDISNVCTGESWWGGWGSNPRPADYEKPGPALRTRYLHGYYGFVPLKAVIAPFARVTRSTNRSTVAALVSAHSVTVRNIAKERRAYVRGERRHSLPRLDTRIECDAANAPNMRGRQRLGLADLPPILPGWGPRRTRPAASPADGSAIRYRDLITLDSRPGEPEA